jgi:hypothetical protein
MNIEAIQNYSTLLHNSVFFLIAKNKSLLHHLLVLTFFLQSVQAVGANSGRKEAIKG